VIVLDDGTPKKYLDKIKQNHPFAEFQFSEAWSAKIKEQENALKTGIENFSKNVPIQFWRKAVEDTGKYFVLTEDDIWYTKNINLNEYALLTTQEKINMLKLYWFKNPLMIKGVLESVAGSDIEIIKPEIPFMAEYIIKNRYYLHSILLLFKRMKRDFYTQLYTVYGIAGHIYNKDFWLYLWSQKQKKIEEMIQLGKALEWKRKFPETKFAKTKEEKLNTSFLTSTSGSEEKLGFSMFRVNHALNEAWYNGQLDAMSNFPKDFTSGQIMDILRLSGMEEKKVIAWKKWSDNFKEHFRSFGCAIE
jgi:hypothetical protein